MSRTMVFYASRDDFGMMVRLYGGMRSPRNPEIVTSEFTRVELRQVPDVEQAMERSPFMRMTDEDAKSLMDALWNAGIRPSNGEGSLGQLGATQRHLEDMRALAFHNVGADKP